MKVEYINRDSNHCSCWSKGEKQMNIYNDRQNSCRSCRSSSVAENLRRRYENEEAYEMDSNQSTFTNFEMGRSPKGYLTGSIKDYSDSQGIEAAYRRRYENETECDRDSNESTCTNFEMGRCTHAEGYRTRAIGDYSHSQGIQTVAQGVASYAKGNRTRALADYALTEGDRVVACGVASHAEGALSKTSANYSHSQGIQTVAQGVASYAKGNRTRALADYALTEGDRVVACGVASHAEGALSKTSANYSHAEGLTNESKGIASHTEGIRTEAKGTASHAEGFGTEALGHVSHAQGVASKAVGPVSHAEGLVTKAYGLASHSQGIATQAKGKGSSSHNLATIANNDYQTVIGKYNRVSKPCGSGKRTDDAFIVGNGRPCARSNAFRVTFDGKVHTDQGGYFATPGRGYTEFFEWSDKNHPVDPVGYFVTLEGDKIKIANDHEKDDFVLGVVTATPGFVANAFENGISNDYATDNFGRIQTNLSSTSELVETNSQVRQGMREVENELTMRIGNQLLSNQLTTEVDTALCPTEESCCLTNVPVLASTCTPTDQTCPQDESREWATVTLVGTVVVRDDGRSRVGDFVVPNKEGIARVANRRRRSRQSNPSDSEQNHSYNCRNNENHSHDDFTTEEVGYRVLRRIDPNTILILFR